MKHNTTGNNQYNTPEKQMEKVMLKTRLLTVLYGHVGRGKMIGMGELFQRVYGEDVANRINDTRRLRAMITELRNEDGVPVISAVAQSEGGYYIASSDSELGDYCDRLKTQALKKLAQVARLKNTGLRSLMGEIQLNLNGGPSQ